MAYLSDYDKVRSQLGLTSTELSDAKIRDHLAAACVELKRWVSASTYASTLITLDAKRTALEEGENLEEDGSLTVQEQALRDAETYLTIAKLFPTLNLVLSQTGGIMVSTVAEKGQTNALSPLQLREAVKGWRRMASTSAWEYVTTKAPGTGLSRARDDDGEVIV